MTQNEINDIAAKMQANITRLQAALNKKPAHYEGRVTEFGGVEHWNGFSWVIFHNEPISGPEMDLLTPENWSVK